jgi:hypothetical protein
MADGKDCKCAAYDESECACDADWTPQELVDARDEIARLRLTEAERKAIELSISKRLDVDAIYTLRKLLERLT